MRFKKALLSGLLGQPTISAQVLAQLRRRGDSLLIPGVGIVDGFASGTYSDSAGATPAVLDDFLGRWVDAGAGGLVFTQTTTPNKPLLTKRVNLLTKTEDFTDAVWAKVGTTIVPNVDGVFSRIVSSAVAGRNRILNTNTVAIPAIATYSLDVKQDTQRYIAFGPSNGSGVVAGVVVDTLTGTRLGDYSYGSASYIESTYANSALPGGGWRVSAAFNTNGATAIEIHSLATSADNVINHAGDGVSGALCTRVQMETGSIATRYQRVNTATDYDTVGFPYRVRFGSNQTLSASIPSSSGYADTTIISALPGGQVTLTGQSLAGVTHTIGSNLDLLGRIYVPNGSSMTASELELYQRYMNNLAGVA